MTLSKTDLTDREREVAGLIASGRTYGEVADLLGISTRTVEEYIQRIARRIPGDVPPRTRILLWWHESDLSEDPVSALNGPKTD